MRSTVASISDSSAHTIHLRCAHRTRRERVRQLRRAARTHTHRHTHLHTTHFVSTATTAASTQVRHRPDRSMQIFSDRLGRSVAADDAEEPEAAGDDKGVRGDGGGGGDTTPGLGKETAPGMTVSTGALSFAFAFPAAFEPSGLRFDEDEDAWLVEPEAEAAAAAAPDASASTRAARAPRLCCPRRDSLGYSHIKSRRVHWL
ncbi:hypothetical protein GY45DRAFT_182766 [Cubamyces sp. BRFM 1775]|nr:hypothetical protein GY45DRAFT_182766 [Cubamyces sp. BRFM 1775]